MKTFFQELRRRNSLLYYFGWLCLVSALVCAIATQFTDIIVLGINAFIKPMKFFISICIFCWTIAWYAYYLQQPRKVFVYSVAVVLVFVYEMFVIVWQAANGRLSHFNIDTPLYGVLFALMGLAIVLFTFWTAYIGFLFFRKRDFNLPASYVWGIRIGIVLFLVFTIEGGMMSGRLSHTVGAPDGSPGLPIVNWSKEHGDLRIAHFVGMHALQIIPLFGYYVTRKVALVLLFGLGYLTLATAILIQALNKMPLFS
jgi:hypothetical protein